MRRDQKQVMIERAGTQRQGWSKESLLDDGRFVRPLQKFKKPKAVSLLSASGFAAATSSKDDRKRPVATVRSNSEYNSASVDMSMVEAKRPKRRNDHEIASSSLLPTVGLGRTGCHFGLSSELHVHLCAT